MCMSRIARSNYSPAAHPAERLERRRGVRGDHVPAADLRPRRSAGWSRCRRRRGRGSPRGRGDRGGGRHEPGRLVRVHDQVERRALARDPGALRVERAVHQLRQPAADREAEARAAVPPADRRVDLAERLEQPVHAVRRDPDAGVPDVQRDLPAVDVRRAGGRCAGRPAAAPPRRVRELERVRQQVERRSGAAGRRRRRGPSGGPGRRRRRARRPSRRRPAPAGRARPRSSAGARTAPAPGPPCRPRSSRSRGCR